MTTATTRKSKGTAESEPLRTINGLTFTPTCKLGDAEQFEADEINLLTDDVARREEQLQNEREAIFQKWFDTTPRSWQAASAPFRDKADKVREDKRAILVRRVALLPKCQHAYMLARAKAEAELSAVLDRLEGMFRGQGINEFSFPNGEHTNSNPEAVRARFRDRLLQEPEAMVATAAVNEAISNLNVLVSQFPIVPTDGNTAIKWRAVNGCQVPPYVTQLFV